MIDINARIKNRIYRTHDFTTLWRKLRAEGFSVWEDEDYTGQEQAPYHKYYIEGSYGAPVIVIFREKTEEELAEDRELGFTPYKQEILRVEY